MDIGPGSFYNKIVYRNVDFNRKKNLEKLIEFAKMKKGKKYGMNILNKIKEENGAE